MDLFKKIVLSLFLIFFFFGMALGIYLSQEKLPPLTQKPRSVAPFESQLALKQIPLRIVGLGDSLTRGVGDPKDRGYAGLVTQALKANVAYSSVQLDDEGITGDTTDDLLKVLQKKNVQNEISKANLIFLTIGGNDIVSVLKEHFLSLDLNEFDTKRRHYEHNLNLILEEVHKLNPTASIYYMGLYNPFEDYFSELNGPFTQVLDQWNTAGKTILELYPNTHFIPTFDLFHGKTESLLYKDHFHPNPEGYHLIANRILTHFSIQPTKK
ncbi:MAG TPA: SGNH/GDSL hydrolase family protein [Sporolactobacillaceae bacterium]|nr:SGNH/GDSL hydrolase family protein [Sporolactobacillaceae bacterium]